MKQAKNSEDDSLRRYVELMYSEGSELNKVENLEERKQLACKMAGLDPISPFVKSMMEMTNPKTNVQIINYLNKNNTNLYVKLMSDLPVNKQPSTRTPSKMEQGATASDKAKSSGHFSSGAAPRVGSDKKKVVMVKKPSRVMSGTAPSKKKKGMSVKMGMSAKGKGY